ncbi:MAG: hypothetical protein VKQ33_14175 [Candidatus Sericytochromatia bacterium]|nr:hypothetical protein [Candidatus Sericytochromatia bacterium]
MPTSAHQARVCASALSTTGGRLLAAGGAAVSSSSPMAPSTSGARTFSPMPTTATPREASTSTPPSFRPRATTSFTHFRPGSLVQGASASVTARPTASGSRVGVGGSGTAADR